MIEVRVVITKLTYMLRGNRGGRFLFAHAVLIVVVTPMFLDTDNMGIHRLSHWLWDSLVLFVPCSVSLLFSFSQLNNHQFAFGFSFILTYHKDRPAQFVPIKRGANGSFRLTFKVLGLLRIISNT